MSTLAELNTIVSIDLGDENKVHYLTVDIDTAIQNGYDDIAINSRCILKTATVSWVSNRSYYDIVTLGVSDYFAPLAIYDNNQKRFLFDDLTLKDFDNMREDWEIWTGTPEWWTPSAYNRIAIMPRHSTATGNFTLYYAATANTLSSGTTPTVVPDMQRLLYLYAEAELLERSHEFTKALKLWEQYYMLLEEYTERCSNLARPDLILRA